MSLVFNLSSLFPIYINAINKEEQQGKGASAVVSEKFRNCNTDSSDLLGNGHLEYLIRISFDK